QAAALQRVARLNLWRGGLLAAVTWLALGTLVLQWPNKEVGFSDWAYTDEFGVAALTVAAVLALLSVGGPWTARVVFL
ncbi:hypothetical protein ABTK64_20685, partial [Acinetobacter baumannii]